MRTSPLGNGECRAPGTALMRAGCPRRRCRATSTLLARCMSVSCRAWSKSVLCPQAGEVLLQQRSHLSRVLQVPPGLLPGQRLTLTAGSTNASYAPVDWRKAAREQYPGPAQRGAVHGALAATAQRAAAGAAFLASWGVLPHWAAQRISTLLLPGASPACICHWRDVYCAQRVQSLPAWPRAETAAAAAACSPDLAAAGVHSACAAPSPAAGLTCFVTGLHMCAGPMALGAGAAGCSLAARLAPDGVLAVDCSEDMRHGSSPAALWVCLLTIQAGLRCRWRVPGSTQCARSRRAHLLPGAGT